MNDQPVHPHSNGIVDRAKSIILKPSEEWPKIAADPEAPMQVFTRWVVPLAAIGPIAGFIGGQVFGYGAFGISYRPGLMSGLTTAIVSYVGTLVGIWVFAWIANFISTKFDGKDDYSKAFQLGAYSLTAAWVIGIVGLIPALSVLGILGLYSFYLFYKGANPMMGVPQDKTIVYTLVTALCAIVVNMIIAAIAAAITGAGAMAGGLAASNADTGGDEVTIDFGPYGRIEANEDGAVATFRDENGEEMTITMDEGSE